MGTSLAERPPPALRALLGCLDAADGGTRMVIAQDLLARRPDLDRDRLAECNEFLARLLSDPATSNADLKGMLNRLEGRAWSVHFEFGADAKGARRYLEALLDALSREVA